MLKVYVPFSPAREHESIYLHRSGPLLENCLDKPENRYGRYGLASFFQHIHIYCRARVGLKVSFLTLWMLVVDIYIYIGSLLPFCVT